MSEEDKVTEFEASTKILEQNGQVVLEVAKVEQTQAAMGEGFANLFFESYWGWTEEKKIGEVASSFSIKKTDLEENEQMEENESKEDSEDLKESEGNFFD
jgi:hypothetical protein